MKVHPIDPSSDTPAIANTRNKSPYWCVLAITLVFIIVLMSMNILLSSVWTHKYNRKHITTIPELKIDSLTASNFTLSSRPNQIFAAWNLRINLETKNKYGHLNFSNITVSVFYNNVLQVGLTNVAPFDVVALNSTTHFDVKFSGSSGLMDDSRINDMKRRIGAAGTLTFDVVFQAYVKKSFEGRWTDHLQLEMDCEDIKLFFGYSDKSRAQMLNPPRQCEIAAAYSV